MPKKTKIVSKKKNTAKKTKIAKTKKDKVVKKKKPQATKEKKVAIVAQPVESGESRKKISQVASVRGMNDILPQEGAIWLKLFGSAQKICEAYGYDFIETPIVEESALFERSIGAGTDVIEKEMYVFRDRDGSILALRPEGTASVVRAYIENGLQTRTQPVKVWYWGQMFRHDRPQKNRYRQFHQFSCEVLGDEHNPVMDAELISIAYNFLKDLGIETALKINSIGNLEDRERYIVELVGYLRSKRSYLCEDCKKRMNKNPLRVLDCKNKSCQTVIEESPQIVDWLSEESKNFFMKVLEYLDALGLPYVLQPRLVRGLDYYTDTVFELTPVEEENEEGSQYSFGGGGRYDKLAENLGGQSMSACGFAIGLERVVNKLKELRKHREEITEEKEEGIKIYFAQLGEQARQRALYLIEEMRRNGIVVKHNLAKSALKVQLEYANKYEVDYTIILGQREVQDGTIIIRDMESGIQEIIDQKKMIKKIKKILESQSV